MVEKNKIEQIIRSAPIENEYWDFKQTWYKNNGDLIGDILNFVNTTHHNDCYLIIGVEDETGKIVGVENETKQYRKNRQMLQNLIRNQVYAENFFPRTNVDTFKIDGHEIDVITIFNSNKTPIFLKKKINGINANLIYSRINDENTPKNESTTDDQMERLWKKRFHMDVKIIDRIKYELLNVDSWEKIIDENVDIYISNENPDIVIKLMRNENSLTNAYFHSFLMGPYYIRVDSYLVKILYNQTVIYKNKMVSLFDYKYDFVWPEESFIPIGGMNDDKFPYYYFIKNNMQYLISMLIFKLSETTEKPVFINDTVIYNSNYEKEYCEISLANDINNKGFSNLQNFTDGIKSVNDYLKYISYKIERSGTNGESLKPDDLSKFMYEQHKTVNLLKKKQLEYKKLFKNENNQS